MCVRAARVRRMNGMIFSMGLCKWHCIVAGRYIASSLRGEMFFDFFFLSTTFFVVFVMMRDNIIRYNELVMSRFSLV